MPDYIDLNLTADAEQLRQDARDWLLAQAPAGYTIDAFVDWLLGAAARMAVEDVIVAGQVPITIFQTLGGVLGVATLDATSATGTVTFTLADDDGHTVEAGANLSIDDIAFVTTTDLVIAPGDTTGQVPVVALNPGSDATGLTGATVELISPTYTWIDSVTLDAATIGGADGETGDQYADRLADELPTLSPKAILLEDFEALARRDPLVGRALAIDNLVPPSTTGVEGAVTVAVHDASGEPVPAGTKTAITAVLEASRVLNLDVYVIDPTYTDIDVSFTATAHDGWDTAAVEAAGIAALEAFLAPAAWGRPAGADETAWIDEDTVRRNDLIGVLYAVEGLRHVTALTLAETGDPLATSDVALATPAPLPRPSTITGTVT